MARKRPKRIKLSRKVCATCGIEKDISMFRLKWRNDDGSIRTEPHEHDCRACATEKFLKAIKEHPERYTGAVKEGEDDRDYIVL